MTAPVAVDLARTRCPDIPESYRAEGRRLTPAPSGTGPLVSFEAKETIDALRGSELRKNVVIRRVIEEFDRCRGVSAPAS